MSGSGEMTSYEKQSLEILGNIDEKMDVLMRLVMSEKPARSLPAQPNGWIEFTQRVRRVLLENGAELKGFIGQTYSAYLKDKYGDDYSSISDETIKEEWIAYLPNNQGSAVASAVASAVKPKRQWSEAAKAAAAEKRAAAKLSKVAAGEGGKRKTRRRRA